MRSLVCVLVASALVCASVCVLLARLCVCVRASERVGLQTSPHLTSPHLATPRPAPGRTASPRPALPCLALPHHRLAAPRTVPHPCLAVPPCRAPLASPRPRPRPRLHHSRVGERVGANVQRPTKFGCSEKASRAIHIIDISTAPIMIRREAKEEPFVPMHPPAPPPAPRDSSLIFMFKTPF